MPVLRRYGTTPSALSLYPQPVHGRTHHAGSDGVNGFPAHARYAAVNPTRSADYEQTEVVVPPY